MKRLLFDCGTRDATASLALAFLRVATGLMMLFGHGWPKIGKYGDLAAGWPVPQVPILSWMSPEVSFIATLVAEILAAALLALGLLTRPAAFVMGFAMVIAAFQVHANDSFFHVPGERSKELALMYLIPAITLLLGGAGAWSLDAKIHREDRRRRWS